MGLKLGHAKFQPSIPKRIFSNWWLNERGSKKCAFFNGKLGHISETVRDRAQVANNNKRKN